MTSVAGRQLDGGQLVLATHNRGKIAEIVALLAPLGVRVVSAPELGLSEPAETEDSFVGNARIKAIAAARATGLPSLADDSGLELDALGGAPGVYSADWAETPTGRDFDRAMRLVRQRLAESGATAPYRGRFRCTLVLAWPDGEYVVFQGVAEGQVVWPPRGARGHGYDPIFQADGEERTFAELGPDRKNALSHRARALEAFVSGCFT